MKKFSGLLLLSLPLLWSVESQAIPSSYGSSTHSNPKWQQLGPDANTNDGVSWSVDNGLTWANSELFVGQTVQFKFHMHKETVGTHYADHVGAWLDWDQDGAFDTSDQIAYGEHILSTSKGVVNTAVESRLGNYSPDTPDIFFLSDEFQLTSAHVGETWLRAVVACSESIVQTYSGHANWDAQWTADYKDNYQDRLFPVGHYYQGETENYRLVVNQVSAPASFLLLGLGLAGVVATRKRMK